MAPSSRSTSASVFRLPPPPSWRGRPPGGRSPVARQLAGTLLVVFCLGIVSYHVFGLAPRMATVKETVVSLEAAPEENPARREFSRLHGISMTLNLVVILAGVVLILWYEMFRS